MYKFTVEYYFSRYHTGSVNEERTRTAVVFANNRKEAVDKIREVDDHFIRSAKITFEEVKGGAE